MTRGFYILAYAYALRAILIILTPFGSSLDDPTKQYGATNIQQNGSFPSGHTIMVVVAFILLDKRDNLWVRALLGLSVIVEVVCLLISHGHYSLDIAGSFMAAYIACYEVDRLMKKRAR